MGYAKDQKSTSTLHNVHTRVSLCKFQASMICVSLCTIFRAPCYIRHDLDLDKNFYNLTLTHRLDSDIVFYYGKARDIKANKEIAPAMNVQWKQPENDFKGKTRVEKTLSVANRQESQI
jgi:hypothetical protein